MDVTRRGFLATLALLPGVAFFQRLGRDKWGVSTAATDRHIREARRRVDFKFKNGETVLAYNPEKAVTYGYGHVGVVGVIEGRHVTKWTNNANQVQRVRSYTVRVPSPAMERSILGWRAETRLDWYAETELYTMAELRAMHNSVPKKVS